MVFQVMGADTKLHLKPSREITQKVYKRELSFLYATYHDLFYITGKYHDYTPNGFRVTYIPVLYDDYIPIVFKLWSGHEIGT